MRRKGDKINAKIEPGEKADIFMEIGVFHYTDEKMLVVFKSVVLSNDRSIGRLMKRTYRTKRRNHSVRDTLVCAADFHARA